MTTFTTRIALTLASFGFASFLGVSTAQAGEHGGKDRADRAGRMCAELACTPAQKARIDAIHAAKKPQMQAARDTMRKLHDQLEVELRRPTVDAKAVERIDAQIAAQRAAMQSQRRASQLQVLALLNADQKAKFVDKMDRKGGKHGGKHGGKRGGPKGGDLRGKPQRG